MRALIVVLLMSFLAPSAPAAESPILVLKLTSVHAALDDMEALGMFEDPQAEREQFLHEMVKPLHLPLGEWLDRNRPAFVTATQAGMMGEKEAIVALLPALDVPDALRALGGDPESEPEDGVHEIDHGEDAKWYVIGEDDYLTIGMKRDEVVGFDRAAIESLDLPPGNMGLEINMEIVTPMLQGLIATQRQTMKQQLEQIETEQGDLQEPEPPVRDPEALLGIMDFYFETVLTILSNTASFQLSLDGSDDSAVFRARVVPTEGSDLEVLLAEQPVGFSKLSRAVPREPALVSYSGNFRLTDELREGLSGFVDGYVGVMEQMAGMVPEMSWMTDMMGGQLEMAKSRFACMSGDTAGIWDMGGEEGIRSIQLSGVLATGDCDTLADRELEGMTQLLGPDGESLVTVTEPNVAPGDVRVRRVEFDMESLLQDDEAASEVMKGMLGGQGPVSYYGQLDDTTLSVTGPNAEETFSAVVDRLQSRRKRGGLTPEAFAPLEAGAGFFAIVDLSLFDLIGLLGAAAPETDTEGEEQADDEEAAGEDSPTRRVVFGAHAQEGKLAIELALSAEVLRSWLDDGPDDGVPADLWPPPPAPVLVEEKASSSEERTGDDAVVTAGDEGVTLPVLVHKIAPDYPEILRKAQLEGRVILQAVVSREGTVRELDVLQCTGKSPREAEPRENLLHESTFCTALIDAAVAAVERWRYEPARRGEEPVDVYFTVRVDFELE